MITYEELYDILHTFVTIALIIGIRDKRESHSKCDFARRQSCHGYSVGYLNTNFQNSRNYNVLEEHVHPIEGHSRCGKQTWHVPVMILELDSTLYVIAEV